MEYSRFRQVLVEPYWCEGSPLSWETRNKVGIASFARSGNVGLFNISWWLVNRRTPPLSDQGYAQVNLWWAIRNGPRIRIGGRTLEHHAAMKCRCEFERTLLSYRGNKTVFERDGMTWTQLEGLCLASTRKEQL